MPALRFDEPGGRRAHPDLPARAGGRDECEQLALDPQVFGGRALGALHRPAPVRVEPHGRRREEEEDQQQRADRAENRQGERQAHEVENGLHRGPGRVHHPPGGAAQQAHPVQEGGLLQVVEGLDRRHLPHDLRVELQQAHPFDGLEPQIEPHQAQHHVRRVGGAGPHRADQRRLDQPPLTAVHHLAQRQADGRERAHVQQPQSRRHGGQPGQVAPGQPEQLRPESRVLERAGTKAVRLRLHLSHAGIPSSARSSWPSAKRRAWMRNMSA